MEHVSPPSPFSSSVPKGQRKNPNKKIISVAHKKLPFLPSQRGRGRDKRRRWKKTISSKQQGIPFQRYPSHPNTPPSTPKKHKSGELLKGYASRAQSRHNNKQSAIQQMQEEWPSLPSPSKQLTSTQSSKQPQEKKKKAKSDSLPHPLPQKKDVLTPLLNHPRQRRLNEKLFPAIGDALSTEEFHPKYAEPLLVLLERNLKRKELAFTPYESILYKLIEKGALLSQDNQKKLLELLTLHLKPLNFTQEIPKLNQLIISLASWCWEDAQLVAQTQKIFLRFWGHTSSSDLGSEKEAIQEELLKQLTLYPWEDQKSLTISERKLFKQCMDCAIQKGSWSWIVASQGKEQLNSWAPHFSQALKKGQLSAIAFYQDNHEYLANFSIAPEIKKSGLVGTEELYYSAIVNSAAAFWRTCLDETEKINLTALQLTIASRAKAPDVQTWLYLKGIADDEENATVYWSSLATQQWQYKQFNKQVWKQFKKSHTKNKENLPLSIYQKLNQVAVDKAELAKRLIQHLQEDPKWKVKGLALLVELQEELQQPALADTIDTLLTTTIDLHSSFPPALLQALLRKIREGKIRPLGTNGVLLALTYPQLETTNLLEQAWTDCEREVELLKEFPAILKRKVNALIQAGTNKSLVFIQEKFFNNPKLYGATAPEILMQFLQKVSKEEQKTLLNSPGWKKFYHYLQGSAYAEKFLGVLKRPKSQSTPFSWKNISYEAETRPCQATQWLLGRVTKERKKVVCFLAQCLKEEPPPLILKHALSKEPLRRTLLLDQQRSIAIASLENSNIKTAADFILGNSELQKLLFPLIKKAFTQKDEEVLALILQKNGIPKTLDLVIHWLEASESASSWTTLKKALLKLSTGVEEFLKNRLITSDEFGKTPEERKTIHSLIEKKRATLIYSKKEIPFLVEKTVNLPHFLSARDDPVASPAQIMASLFVFSSALSIEDCLNGIVHHFQEKINHNDSDDLTKISRLFYLCMTIVTLIKKNNPKDQQNRGMTEILHYATPFFYKATITNIKDCLSNHSGEQYLEKAMSEENPMLNMEQIDGILSSVNKNKLIESQIIQKLYKPFLKKIPSYKDPKSKVQYLHIIKKNYLILYNNRRVSDKEFQTFFNSWTLLFLSISREELLINPKEHLIVSKNLLELYKEYKNKFQEIDSLHFSFLILQLRTVSILSSTDELKNQPDTLRILWELETKIKKESINNKRFFSSFVCESQEGIEDFFISLDSLLKQEILDTEDWTYILPTIFKKIMNWLSKDKTSVLAISGIRKLRFFSEGTEDKKTISCCDAFVHSLKKELPSLHGAFWERLAECPTDHVINLFIIEYYNKNTPDINNESKFWKKLIGNRLDKIKNQSMEKLFSDILLKLLFIMNDGQSSEFKKYYFTNPIIKQYMQIVDSNLIFLDFDQSSSNGESLSNNHELQKCFSYFQGKTAIPCDITKNTICTFGEILKLKIMRKYAQSEKGSSENDTQEPFLSEKSINRFLRLASKEESLCYEIKIHFSCLQIDGMRTFSTLVWKWWQEACLWITEENPTNALLHIALQRSTDALRFHFALHIIKMAKQPSNEEQEKQALSSLKTVLLWSHECNLFSHQKAIDWIEEILSQNYLLQRTGPSPLLETLNDLILTAIAAELAIENNRFIQLFSTHFEKVAKGQNDLDRALFTAYTSHQKISSYLNGIPKLQSYLQKAK